MALGLARVSRVGGAEALRLEREVDGVDEERRLLLETRGGRWRGGIGGGRCGGQSCTPLMTHGPRCVGPACQFEEVRSRRVRMVDDSNERMRSVRPRGLVGPVIWHVGPSWGSVGPRYQAGTFGVDGDRLRRVKERVARDADARPCLLAFKNSNFFKISRYIESFRRMYKVLNLNKNKNELHSLIKIYEMYFLNLVNLWLNNNYHKQTKIL